MNITDNYVYGTNMYSVAKVSSTSQSEVRGSCGVDYESVCLRRRDGV
jgi:hypothetical protein